MTRVAVKAYVKTTSRTAMSLLSEARNLQHLQIDSGLYSHDTIDPVKAAKAFYADAHKFLEAVNAKAGNKRAGVDALTFGPMALVEKEKGGKSKAWRRELVEEFKECLRAKMMYVPPYSLPSQQVQADVVSPVGDGLSVTTSPRKNLNCPNVSFSDQGLVKLTPTGASDSSSGPASAALKYPAILAAKKHFSRKHKSTTSGRISAMEARACWMRFVD